MKAIIFDLMHDNHVYVKNEDTCKGETQTTPQQGFWSWWWTEERGAPVVMLPRLSAGPVRKNVCMCVVGTTITCVLSFVERHAGVLQALQLKPPAAAKQKCLSGQQHKPHGWYLICCSCINGKGKELDVKHSFCSKNEEHLVHITAFKEDIYAVEKYNTLPCVHVVVWKDLLFRRKLFGHVLAVRERSSTLIDHIHRMLEQTHDQS